MRRRNGFTLPELLVAVALILFIMVILAEIFTVGQACIQTLKAVADAEARMRTPAIALRNDLGWPHFEGNRRLSDPAFWQTGPPVQGFFVIRQGSAPAPPTVPIPPYVLEGHDGDNIFSYRATDHVLHFTIRRRGNKPDSFVSTSSLPSGSTLPTAQTSFDATLSQTDARCQEGNTFTSQWAEVAYFLQANNTNAGSNPLYNLYRCQYVVVPDNTQVSYVSPISGSYPDMSRNPTNSLFNSPGDLTTQANRALNLNAYTFPLSASTPLPNAANLVVNDVISFQVQIMRGKNNAFPGDTDFVDVPGNMLFDSSTQPSPSYIISAIRITLRTWDAKTQQARQITIVQDL